MREFTRATHALSDETRIRIVNLIMKRECCVCEVMQALGISQTRASRNLKILYDAGLLNKRNDGLYTLYSIKARRNEDFCVHLMCAVRDFLERNTTARRDLQRLDKAVRVGPSCVSELTK
ncbi:MAG: winged helix-turn-helix transcriptional regulator [Dehalococcoidia bacterium]|nr:MAG: winged helix-turn-helix transcriptional regulator [Dehalococcoidia bacterium]